MKDVLARMSRAKAMIEQEKDNLAKAKGMMERIREDLKSLIGTDDLDEAEERLRAMKAQIEEKEALLERAIEDTEALLLEIEL